MNPYEVLGVARNAELDTIQRAYRRMAQAFHPDKGGTAEIFQRINAAWSILSDAERRRQYDATGNTQPGPDLEAMAREIIIQTVMQVIELSQTAVTSHAAVVESLRNTLAASLAQVLRNQASAEARAAKLLRASRGIKRKSGDNFVSTHLAAEAERVRAAIEDSRVRTRGLQRAIEIAAEFEGDRESATQYFTVNDYSQIGYITGV